MNLVLIGYRGTGKSAVAAALAPRLGLRAVSLDAVVVERAGRSIGELVAAHGWDRFRELESDVVRDLAGGDGLVLDTGGGVVERAENVAALRRGGLVVWLTAPVSLLLDRIGSATDRPALTAGRTFTDEVADVLARRTPLYRAAADHAVETGGLTVEEVADAVAALWAERPPRLAR